MELSEIDHNFQFGCREWYGSPILMFGFFLVHAPSTLRKEPARLSFLDKVLLDRVMSIQSCRFQKATQQSIVLSFSTGQQ